MKVLPAAALILALALALILPADARPAVAAQTDCVQPLTYDMLDGDGGFIDAWISDEPIGCASVHRPADDDAPRDGMYVARYYTFSISGTADVTIALESPIDTYLYLLEGTGMDGTVLYRNDDIDLAARNFNSRIHETLGAGDYTIEATTYDADYPTPVIEFELTVNGITPQPSAVDDRAALVAFYHATSGDNWDNNDNWLSEARLGEWYGVKTDDKGRVTDLDLHTNDLSGHIPPELGNLSQLIGLYLDDNQLIGAIPPELGKLVKLIDLFLEENELTGTIPPELGNLASLEVLLLSDNRLWGELPNSLTALNRLIAIEFDDNSGLCAPPEPAFQEWLRKIEYEGHTCVRPSSPPDDREIAALTALYNATGGDDWRDGSNWLSDEPAQFWSGISVNSEGHVTELRLRGNNLSGQIPTELSHLTSLKLLNLGGNELTGNIPEELGSLTELESLDLYKNQLTGNIPEALGNLTNLRRLDLDGNKLTGSIPPEIGNLTTLEHLEIYRNRLTGSIPSELGNLSRLEELLIGGNELTGPIPPELGKMQELRDLSIYGNRLEGPVPPELNNLGSLEELNLSGNRLTGEFPSGLVNLRKLRELNLADNRLSGELPSQIGEFEALEILQLDDNQFSGSIPAELSKLSPLWILEVARNQLSSEIPSELGNLQDLNWLDLSGNQLTGHIPVELGNLINLRDLDLSDNQLSGDVPAELGKVTDLKMLEVNDNLLSGQLPHELAGLSLLERLYFHNNAGLCAPADADFQEWLRSIETVEGDTCDAPPPYPERTWTIDRSLTIGDFTMRLRQITDTADGLNVEYSYETDLSELDYLPNDNATIRYPDGSVHDTYMARLPEEGEVIDVSLGGFIVFDADLNGGSVDIPLASVSDDGALNPQPELSVGDGRYGVTKLIYFEENEQLTITIQPLNEAAKYRVLAFGSGLGESADVTLTDDFGITSESVSGSSAFDRFEQTLDFQTFDFLAVSAERFASVTKFTLTVRGGGNIVGPFVFEDVSLPPEDAAPKP